MFSEDPEVLREQAKILIRHAEALVKEAERIEDDKTIILFKEVNFEPEFVKLSDEERRLYGE